MPRGSRRRGRLPSEHGLIQTLTGFPSKTNRRPARWRGGKLLLLLLEHGCNQGTEFQWGSSWIRVINRLSEETWKWKQAGNSISIQRWIIQTYSVVSHQGERQVRERVDVVISSVRSNSPMVLTNREVRTKAERKKRGIRLIVAFRWNAPEHKGFLWQLVTHFDRDRQITQGFTWKERDQKSHRGLRLQSGVNVLFYEMGLYCHTLSLSYQWYMWELPGDKRQNHSLKL